MKHQTDAKMLLQVAHDNNLSLNASYSFQFNGRQVRVIFSGSQNAQTVEDALVKIATRRII